MRPLLGGASATDRQRVEAVLRRGVRSGLYPSQQTANGIVDSADDKLFELSYRVVIVTCYMNC